MNLCDSARPAKKKCCVEGCEIKNGSFYRFPNPKKNEKLLLVWLQAIGNERLFEIPRDKLFKSSLVCARHFEPSEISYGTRRGLKWNAVPKLFLNQNTHEDLIFNMPSTSYEQDHSYARPTSDIVPETSNQMEEDCEKVVICTSARKRTSILRKVNVTRQKYLTPEAKHFYGKVIESSKKISRLTEKVNSFKMRMKAAENLSGSKKFENLLNHVNVLTYNFILSQVRTQEQKPKARRFTLDEKIMALTLLKASGKGYRLLSKLFALPSKRTLTNLLNRVPFNAGICNNMFESLRRPVSKMKLLDRTAILVFDEMAISSLVHYNPKDDVITGVYDEGDGRRKCELADHANVFLLKGVFRQWKQPVCYTFSGGPSKAAVLKNLIVAIIRKSHDIGINVIATVCDQGSTNQSAINLLLKETNEFHQRKNIENKLCGFLVDDQEIVPLYDTPHLFKGLRNNLLNKDLHFSLNNKKLVAKWEHIEQFYLLDCDDENRICNKLTDQHIMRGKINKMKVSCCTQVFSYQVGMIMKKIITWKSQVKLDPEAVETAELILFLDKLFDSLNSSRKTGPPGKPMKASVTANSGHLTYWHNSIIAIKTMQYYCPESGKLKVVPTLKNLIVTLRGFIYLCKKILNVHKNKYVSLRVFQQDALENFFGCIRNYSGRENMPSASHFIASFKSLVINNFMSAHSPGANCEEDESTGALVNLQGFLLRDIEAVSSLEVEIPEIPSNILLHRRNKISKCTVTYIAGFIAKKMMRTIQCSNCRDNCLKRHSDSDTDFIDARQYEKSKLVKPGNCFYFLVAQSISRLFYLIPRLCHCLNISSVLENILTKQLSFNIINCPEHKDSANKLVKIIVRCCLYFWCKRINLVTKGKDEKFTRFLNNHPSHERIDPIKLSAYKKFKARVIRSKAQKKPVNDSSKNI